MECDNDGRGRWRYETYQAAVDVVQIAQEAIGDLVNELSDDSIRKELNNKGVRIVMSDGDSLALKRWDCYDDWSLSRKSRR